jgi:Transglycosylase SLT domain
VPPTNKCLKHSFQRRNSFKAGRPRQGMGAPRGEKHRRFSVRRGGKPLALLDPPMRVRPALLMLLALLAACAPLRRATPPAAPSIALLPPPPPAPRYDLGALDHPRIDAWEQRLREHPGLRQVTADSLARGSRYLPGLRRILAENGVPASLALLPVIESGFYPTARGRLDERGLWQLRRSTARRFGLVVNRHRDDRLQPELATRAAAQYLRLLRDRYGDWALALAAYNAGERRVDRALARDPEASFWRLAEYGYLPRISREYVPRFFAVVRLAGEQEPAALGSAL